MFILLGICIRFGVTADDTQGLYLTLKSEISPWDGQKIIQVSACDSGMSSCKGSALLIGLFL